MIVQFVYPPMGNIKRIRGGGIDNKHRPIKSPENILVAAYRRTAYRLLRVCFALSVIYDYGFRDVDTKRIASDACSRVSRNQKTDGEPAVCSQSNSVCVVPVIPLKQIILYRWMLFRQRA